MDSDELGDSDSDELGDGDNDELEDGVSEVDPKRWRLDELERLSRELSAEWVGATAKLHKYQIVRTLRSRVESWDRERLAEALYVLLWRKHYSAAARGSELDAAELWRTAAYVILGVNERQRASEIAQVLVKFEQEKTPQSQTAIRLENEGGFAGLLRGRHARATAKKTKAGTTTGKGKKAKAKARAPKAPTKKKMGRRLGRR